MIAALALTAAGSALIGAAEYARIRLVRARFARAVHAQRRAVPPGMAPPSPGGAVAVTHPTRPQAGVGGGHSRRLESVSHAARPVAPTTHPAAGAVVVGAQFGPAGSTYNTSGRPGPFDGAA